ncbi:MFS transporter [Kroppenstedtia guangzhouensis]|uniref:MFS transporter n=1 Tax=Kroppenstedtia guangzhouensis TaxID=1274356 RepID=A0ABQ1GSG5_9BACL|nr:MFS transporter [Kroppenstedtia guangzhouensis]GGA49542.1 MFS transporter [Kroppenstedtia guangzhouensis]
MASLFLILYLTNSALLVSLYMLAKMIPGLVFSPYGGVFSDRFNRRTVVILTDLVRIGAALLPLFVVSEEQVWLIILSAALLTSASSVFFPAEKGLVTEVAAGDLAKTNSVMASGEAISMIVGSALGGIVASENVKLAFIINAATFAVSLITTIAINLASPAQKKEKQKADPLSLKAQIRPRQILKDMVEGFYIIRKHPILTKLIFLAVGVALAGGGINVLLSVIAKHQLDIGALGIGSVYAALGLGSFLGSVLAPRLMKKNFSLTQIIGWAAMFEGVFIGLYTQSTVLLLSVGALFIAGIFSTVDDTATDTLIMSDTPKDVLGRFYSFHELCTTLSFSVSTFMTGLIIEWFPVQVGGMIISGIWIFVGASWLFTTRGHVRKDIEAVDLSTMKN